MWKGLTLEQQIKKNAIEESMRLLAAAQSKTLHQMKGSRHDWLGPRKGFEPQTVTNVPRNKAHMFKTNIKKVSTYILCKQIL
jgi:hypothetical protein